MASRPPASRKDAEDSAVAASNRAPGNWWPPRSDCNSPRPRGTPPATVHRASSPWLVVVVGAAGPRSTTPASSRTDRNSSFTNAVAPSRRRSLYPIVPRYDIHGSEDEQQHQTDRYGRDPPRILTAGGWWTYAHSPVKYRAVSSRSMVSHDTGGMSRRPGNDYNGAPEPDTTLRGRWWGSSDDPTPGGQSGEKIVPCPRHRLGVRTYRAALHADKHGSPKR